MSWHLLVCLITLAKATCLTSHARSVGTPTSAAIHRRQFLRSSTAWVLGATLSTCTLIDDVHADAAKIDLNEQLVLILRVKEVTK